MRLNAAALIFWLLTGLITYVITESPMKAAHCTIAAIVLSLFISFVMWLLEKS
jgi:hypothetical protein